MTWTQDSKILTNFLSLLNINYVIPRLYRNSPPEVFPGKGVLNICRKFRREHPCWKVNSIKLLFNFIEITFRHGCSPINLLHIFRTPFPGDISAGLLVVISMRKSTFLVSDLCRNRLILEICKLVSFYTR